MYLLELPRGGHVDERGGERRRQRGPEVRRRGVPVAAEDGQRVKMEAVESLGAFALPGLAAEPLPLIPEGDCRGEGHPMGGCNAPAVLEECRMHLRTKYGSAEVLLKARRSVARSELKVTSSVANCGQRI